MRINVTEIIDAMSQVSNLLSDSPHSIYRVGSGSLLSTNRMSNRQPVHYTLVVYSRCNMTVAEPDE